MPISRPTKLRNACNNCTSAKVKCSGEKGGCVRCQNHDMECIYVESQVGRIPKSGKKRAATDDQDRNRNVPLKAASKADSVQSMRMLPNGGAAIPNNSDLFAPSSILSWSDASMQQQQQQSNTFESSLMSLDDSDIFGSGDKGLDFRAISEEFDSPSFEVPNASHQGLNVHRNGDSASNSGRGLDFGQNLRRPTSRSTSTSTSTEGPYRDPLRHLSGTPTTQSSSTTQRSTASSATTHSSRSRDRSSVSTSSQCVFACVQIVSTLENCIATELRTLDIVLEVIRKAENALNRLIDEQQMSGRQDFRCFALFATVLSQIVELLEAGCRCFLDDGSPGGADGPCAIRGNIGGYSNGNGLRSPGRPQPSAGSFLDHLDNISSGIGLTSDFGFGSFGIMEGQLREMRARNVVKELDHIARILAKIRAMTGTDIDNMSTHQDPCFKNIEVRLRTLHEQMKRVLRLWKE